MLQYQAIGDGTGANARQRSAEPWTPLEATSACELTEKLSGLHFVGLLTIFAA